MKYFLVYILIINLIAFIAMGIDKSKAKKGKWRIKERTLLMFAVFGGGIGEFIGIFTFRHKTRKAKFTVGVPFITLVFALACFGVYYLINSGIANI